MERRLGFGTAILWSCGRPTCKAGPSILCLSFPTIWRRWRPFSLSTTLSVISSDCSTRLSGTTPIPCSSPCSLRDRFVRRAEAGDANARYTFIECLSNIRNVKGRPVQQTKGDPNFIDYYGRPWAQNWEKWFEQGWEKPDENLVPKDVIDLFK